MNTVTTSGQHGEVVPKSWDPGEQGLEIISILAEKWVTQSCLRYQLTENISIKANKRIYKKIILKEAIAKKTGRIKLV